MKKIRKISSLPSIMIPLIMIFLVFGSSCQKENIPFYHNESNILAQKEELRFQQTLRSGEELFKGIIFGEGVIGNKLSDFTFSIQSLAKTKLEEDAIEDLENHIINLISLKHPDYFQNFQQKMTSGHIPDIENGLLSASKVINEVIEFDQNKIDPIKSNAIKSEISKEIKNFGSTEHKKYKDLIRSLFKGQNQKTKMEVAPSRNVNVTYQTNTAIYMYIAAVVAAAMVIVVFIGKENVGNMGVESDSLFKEQVVSKIAEILTIEKY